MCSQRRSAKNVLYFICVDLIMNEEQILNCTLVLIETILRSKNSSLAKWSTMPKPAENSYSLQENQLLQDELNYPREELLARHDVWFG